MDEKYKDKWEMVIQGNEVTFKRFYEKQPLESYAPVSIAKAVLMAGAIIQGYQPVRRLDRLDIPAAGTPPGLFRQNEALIAQNRELKNLISCSCHNTKVDQSKIQR